MLGTIVFFRKIWISILINFLLIFVIINFRNVLKLILNFRLWNILGMILCILEILVREFLEECLK